MKPIHSALGATVLLLGAAAALAGVLTPHLIPFQGRALDSAGQPLATGDVAVRIYDAPSSGTLVYDSGTQFAGAIQDGVFNVLLGEGPALQLDNTRLYYLEVDVNGQEVVGDAAAGRQLFYPGGGSHERQDIEIRLLALEGVVFPECDPGYYNLNGVPRDACEFHLDPNGIYVSQTTGVNDPGCGGGPDSTCGGCYPCRTIGYGIQRAQGAGKSTVYVADGLYEESVSLADGISLRGGYRADTWERHTTTSLSVIRDATSSGHRKAIIAQNIASPTTVEGFVVQGRNAGGAGENSYALWIVNCSAGLNIRHNQIFSGDGGPGSAGVNGAVGATGVNGQNGLNAYEPAAGYDCYEECQGHGAERQGGAGGVQTCAGSNCSGGAGGTADCPNFDETNGNACVQCPTDPYSQTITTSGQSAPNGGGAGGDGGGDAWIDFECAGGCQAFLPTAPGWQGASSSSPGHDGSIGVNGPSGSGGSAGSGTVVANEWIGSSGSAGGNATHGRGGGGGGAGGGVETYYSVNCSSEGHSDIGGSGGGGGSGGCGGNGGVGGSSGGGAIGIFVFFSAAPGINVPTILENVIHRGNGGRAGDGGSGGTGGAGGYGGQGGLGGVGGSSYWAAGAGAPGGNGGYGGHGGGGGGASGGVSFGIYAYGQGGSDLSSWKLGNNFIADGTGGSGGNGGGSLGNLGGPGTTGSSGNTNY